MRELKYVDSLSTRNKLRRLLWNMACALLFSPTPCWALHGWRRLLLRVFGASIGEGCRIDPKARIWAPWNLRMGNYSAIAEGVDCYNVDRISMGAKVAVSQRVFLCTASHDTTTLLRPLVHAPITIGNHVWIAAEAMLHPGLTVPDGAIIAARSVLRCSPEPWTIWAGNPARRVGDRMVRENVHLSLGDGKDERGAR